MCVIFNPAARGDKARRWRAQLNRLRAEAALRPTARPGAARHLAAQAVREGFDVVVAAGGDGTINEVLNGLGDTPDGFARARLGILPLGTTNVLARELGLPRSLPRAWEAILAGRERRLDLPWAEWHETAGPERRYFAQMAGAGLDARAIEAVSWPLKKCLGQLAYVVAGLRALNRPAPSITLAGDHRSEVGELVLLGNGRFYGGPFRLFPSADPTDGLLDVCVFPRAGWLTVLRCAPGLLLRRQLPTGPVRRLRMSRLTLSSPEAVPFELDGELAGRLPVTFGLLPRTLRVAVP